MEQQDQAKSPQKRMGGRFATKKQIAKKQKIVEANTKQAAMLPVDSHTAPQFPVAGRRIVEIETLAKNLFCASCKGRLFLDKILRTIQRGLADVFVIQCESCLLENNVSTSKQHPTGKCGAQRYDVNTKAALGALDAGMGVTHLNKFLAVLNIPTMNPATFKLHEREVGPHVEGVARESCNKAAELERALMEKNFTVVKHLLQSALVRKAATIGSLTVLEGVISKNMRNRMAEEGISFDLMMEVFVTSGKGGINALLGESVNSKPRITRSASILEKLFTFMEQHQKDLL